MDDKLPAIYRLPLRSARGDVDFLEQVEHCLSKRLAGVGWGLDGKPPRSIDEVVARLRADDRPHWHSSGANTVARFAAAPNGSLVWTRHPDGTWAIGELSGSCRPDYTKAAVRVDVYHVRSTRWAPRRVYAEEAPGAVVRAFSGRGSSFSRIHDEVARTYSHRLFSELIGRAIDLPAPSPEDVLHNLLEPYDVEDLVFAYLQVERGYVVLPASRRTDNPTYEYALIKRETGMLTPVSIKSGSVSVDVGMLASTAESAGYAFAYSTGGHYHGDDRGLVERISDDELLAFALSSPKLLPPRVRRWLSPPQPDEYRTSPHPGRATRTGSVVERDTRWHASAQS